MDYQLLYDGIEQGRLLTHNTILGADVDIFF